MIEISRITDIDRLMEWRKEVIEHVFGASPTHEILEANRQYYLEHVPSGKHIAIEARFDGAAAGCGAICLTEELPSPDNPDGKCAYLMNIYVRGEYRSHGIAHAVVRRLISEAKARECMKIYLETTAEGRPVYESLGFRDLPDMMKYYDTDF